MSNTLVYLKFIISLLLLLLLLLSPQHVTMARHEPSSSGALPAQNYVSVKPPLITDQGKEVFREREVKGCKPKGNRHSSTPSRYVNYHTTGSYSSGCSTGRKSRKP